MAISRPRVGDPWVRSRSDVNTGRSLALPALIFVSLAIRAAYALHGPVGHFSWIDGEYYMSVARNISTSLCYCNSQGEFPDFPKIADIGLTAFSVPAYPTFVALVISVFGDSATAIYLAQAVLGALSVWLCYAAANLVAGRRVALLAAAIQAVNPFQIFQVGIIASEGFTAFMLLLVVYATLRWQAALEHRGGPSAVIAVVFVTLSLAAGILTRSAFGPIAIVTLLYMARVARRARQSFSSTASWVGVVAAGCVLLVGPWVLRNHRVFGVWILESKIGLNLNTGFHDLADGTADRGPFAPIVRQDETLRALNEVERDRVHRATALNWMKEHPGRTAWLMMKKAVMFWNPVPRQGEGLLFYVALGWSVVLVGGAIVGLVLGARDFGRLQYLYGVLAMYIAPHLLAYVMTRYRIPVEGLFAIFTAYGLDAVSTMARPHA